MMLPLLDLLASRPGTEPAVRAILVEGRGSVDEVHPNTKEGPLHVLLRRCVLPLELYGLCKVLVDYNVDVNWRDHRGATPLSLLILHINHGLRYHSYTLPQIQRLDDLGAPRWEIEATVAGIDAEYQNQVYRSLELLLAAGAEVNAVPGIVPAIPSNTAWVEAYEHKLMQQEGRWNLLGYETSMEVSTYNIFNPVTSHRCINELGITPLHLAAWRGDARCIKLLLSHGADATAVAQDPNQKTNFSDHHSKWTNRWNSGVGGGGGRGDGWGGAVRGGGGRGRVDSRGPLHFLYMYCNKPSDLVAATHHLIEAGASVDVLHQGDAPCHLLVPHVFVKRTYHQYLSACYVLTELRLDSHHDDYITAIDTCLRSLQSSALQTSLQQTLVLETARQFNRILENTDTAFQQQGHYLVPYTYRLQPLSRFLQVLVSIGAKVNLCDIEGRTPLHHLVASLRNLSLHPGLNPPSDVIQCFSVLLQGGADPNKKDMLGRSVVYLLHTIIMDCLSSAHMGEEAFPCFINLLELLASHGGDLDSSDCEGKQPLPSALGRLLLTLRNRTRGGYQFTRYIEKLVLLGASVDSPLTKGHLECAVSLHLSEHQSTPASHSHSPLTPILLLLCSSLSQPILSEQLRDVLEHESSSMDWRLWPMNENMDCSMCNVLGSCAGSPMSLKTACRRAIRRSVKGGYEKKVQLLPLPPPIIRYLLDFTVL